MSTPIALEQMIFLAICNRDLYVASDGNVQTDSYTLEDGPYPRIQWHGRFWLLDWSHDGDVKVFDSTDELKRALDPLLRGVTNETAQC